MGKIIRRVVLAVLILALAGGFWQWKAYEKKTALRENALMYFQEEDYTKTIQYLKEALSAASVFAGEMDVDMKCYLAESYYQLGEYEEAEAIYDALTETDSDNASYYLLKGECYEAAGKNKKALEVYQQGFAATGQGDFLEKICGIYEENGKYDKALSCADQGMEEGGELRKEFWYRKVLIYEKSQRYAEAYETVCQYLEEYPEDEDAKKEQIFLSTRI